jgi:hypothetical protein
MAEWARTDERAGDRLTTRLSTWLGEAAVCHAGVIAAARLEQTDRPEEEQLIDPFRTPRPPNDLSNLGVSRWTTLTIGLSSPALLWRRYVSGRPFMEIARTAVGPGQPPGLFDANRRYGASRMWMLSAGIRLRAGGVHGRMGRYGVAAPGAGMMMPPGTDSTADESHMMAMHHPPSSINPCTV